MCRAVAGQGNDRDRRSIPAGRAELHNADHSAGRLHSQVDCCTHEEAATGQGGERKIARRRNPQGRFTRTSNCRRFGNRPVLRGASLHPNPFSGGCAREQGSTTSANQLYEPSLERIVRFLKKFTNSWNAAPGLHDDCHGTVRWNSIVAHHPGRLGDRPATSRSSVRTPSATGNGHRFRGLPDLLPQLLPASPSLGRERQDARCRMPLFKDTKRMEQLVAG
jgi:hypothetical protein